MQDAVGDKGNGLALADGSRSLADSAAWRELLELLQANTCLL